MIIDLPRNADVTVLTVAADTLGIVLRNTVDVRPVNTRDAGPMLRAEGVRLGLGADRELYRATRGGRRVDAVSWEGHRDWMRQVFARYPDAIIRTALDTWAGTDDFEARHAASEPQEHATPMNPTPGAR